MPGHDDRMPHLELLQMLAVMSSYSDEESAMGGAVERAAQLLEAEVAAIIVDDRVTACVGYPARAVAVDDLLAVSRHERDILDVPGVGPCPAVSARWTDAHQGHLVVARAGSGFSVEEHSVVRGMARLVSLTLTMLRTLQAEHAMRQRSEQEAREKARLVDSLRERQRLLEHLFDVQRAISRRRPLAQILDLITSAAQDLLGAEMVGLWVADPREATRARLVSSLGLDPAVAGEEPTVPLADAGATGAAMLTDDVVVERSPAANLISELAGGRLSTSMAAPVHDSGSVTGSLLVGSYRPDREYTESDIQTLRAFADQVSLALTDANTVDRMYQAFRDSLTGLASRGLFLDLVRQRLETGPTDVALLFLDLDRFKAVNDALGHAAGDALLVTTANRLRSQLREPDIVSRFGGDEFVIMLSGIATEQDAMAIAQRMLAVLAEPMVIAGRTLSVGASIGIALHTPDVAGHTDLIRRADTAMYQVKRNGRQGCQLFDATTRAAMTPTGTDLDVP
ncbi:MAG TPA: sensor domain-containing diguanylate cyclase [Pseudonocardiaceae bacterium]|nr:sensor domain-containing diguanylate cyclase [Pseudonocardiaceae bacterium]